MIFAWRWYGYCMWLCTNWMLSFPSSQQRHRFGSDNWFDLRRRTRWEIYIRLISMWLIWYSSQTKLLGLKGDIYLSNSVVFCSSLMWFLIYNHGPALDLLQKGSDQYNWDDLPSSNFIGRDVRRCRCRRARIGTYTKISGSKLPPLNCCWADPAKHYWPCGLNREGYFELSI